MNARTRAPNGDILEHLTRAVVLLDAGRTVLFLNPAAETLLHLSARQATGAVLPRLLPGFAALEPAIAQAVARGASYTEREVRLAVASERTVTVDCAITPLADDRLLLELEQLDRHLRISRENRLIAQNQAIRQLIRGLAHEIKNPLGGLRGAAQLLESELGDAEQREYTQIIISEADRLRALVNGLLGPDARPEKRPTNIHEVLERVRHLAEAEAPAGVEIQRDYDPSIPPLPAAPDQLIQAVLNLVRNALQAVGDAGRIRLQTRTQRRFTIGEVQHRLVARIDVIDDGPGIAPELLDRIFYPMVTGRPEGSGIGLPIAQTLVNQHGGLIECSSEPGCTVFTVWLPMEDPDVGG
ncbi:nitrogen regulation protein NR(II) [Sediminicurvatus halobius]|uniref:Sensory histidine kinase/phosphatase NtrB n=1 Tax=Sediminicurvatus halobius TaxID=2182432 RepID=A0A2U2N2Y8_9GAMM|nr:nitrogen regulation protein NR(II) [Spiribacter halobius]PWG63398.1 nitrogen regulation protein NR(II) [Spiribacter halobius]UEX78067.1 nitrogen regulation protein NR(II) [Spiribacter halobius]